MSDYLLVTLAIIAGITLKIIIWLYPHFTTWRKRRTAMWTAFMEFRRAGWPSVVKLQGDIIYWKNQHHYATTDQIKKDRLGQLSFFGGGVDTPKYHYTDYKYGKSHYQLAWKMKDWENFKAGKYCVLSKTRRVAETDLKNNDFIVMFPKLLVRNGEGFVPKNITTPDDKFLVVDEYVWSEPEKAVGKIVITKLSDMPGLHTEVNHATNTTG